MTAMIDARALFEIVGWLCIGLLIVFYILPVVIVLLNRNKPERWL